jgi:putative transposase
MPDYRRHRVPGGTYAFTVNLRDRSAHLLVDAIAVLREAIRATRRRRPFQIDAWVVLPDHMHAIWTLPPGDADYSGRWYDLKSGFSKRLPKTESRTPVLIRRGERGIWQRRFWEHTIRDETDYANHMDYIHWNPVRHGLAPSPAAWPHSTFHHCVRAGLYPANWIGGQDTITQAGEP